MTKVLQQCFLFFIVVVILGHNLGNSQVSVYRTIGPTLVFLLLFEMFFDNLTEQFIIAIFLQVILYFKHMYLCMCLHLFKFYAEDAF